jgi:ABC-2 type transport system permease protein
MSTRRIIQLVAVREMSDRIRNKGLLVGTIATLLLVVGFIVVPTFLEDDTPPSHDLGVVGQVDPLFEQSATAAARNQDAELTITTVEDRAAAETALEDGELDAVLLDIDTVLVSGDLDRQLESIVEQGRQQAALLGGLSEAGIDPGQAGELLAGRPPVSVLTPEGTEDETESGQGLAFFATVLLFLIVQINGSTLLTGTIEEKSSRVVEVLLGSIRPWQLLAGKLSGIMVLALAQLALFVGVTLGSNALVDAFELPPAAGTSIVVALVMFVLGFAFYSSLYAVAGSLASSLEDAQSAAGPLGFLTVGAYMGTLLGVVPDPDSVFAVGLSLFPPTAPFAVPARVAVSAISPVEVVLSAVLVAVTAVLTVRLAGRLYSAAILAGGKLTWREVLRAEPVR